MQPENFDLSYIGEDGKEHRPAVIHIGAVGSIERMLGILKDEGFIRSYKTMGEAPKQSLRVYLKYGPDRTPAISQIVRVSKLGRRRYCGTDNLPRVLSGLGRSILTTSRGVMTDEEAKRQRVGGEILCYVW